MDAADNLLQNKLAPPKITPRKTTYRACPSNSRGRGRGPGERSAEPSTPIHMASPTRPAPPPPRQMSSHRRRHARDENLPSDEAANDAYADSQDAASKIWAKIRRCSGLSMNHNLRNVSSSTEASVAASVSLPLPPACSGDSRALRRKKAGAPDCSALIMQRQRLAAMGSRTSLVDRTNMSMVEDGLGAGKRRSPKGSGRGRKGSGK